MIKMARKCEGKNDRRTVKNVRKIPEGRRSVRKPRKRWLDDAENNPNTMGVRAWRKKS
jgi:hypothetical protein